MQVQQLFVVVGIFLGLCGFASSSSAAFFEPIHCEDLKSRLSEYEVYLSCQDNPACLGKFKTEQQNLLNFLDTKMASVTQCVDETKRPFLVWAVDPRETPVPRLAAEVFKRVGKSLEAKALCEMAQMSLASIVNFETQEHLMATERVLKQEDAYALFESSVRNLQRQNTDCHTQGVNILLGLTDYEPELPKFSAFYLERALAALPSRELGNEAKSEFLKSFIERSLDLSPSVTERVLALAKLTDAVAELDLMKVAVENLNLPAVKVLKDRRTGSLPAEAKSWLCQAQAARGPWSKEMLGEALGVLTTCPQAKATTAMESRN